MIEMQFTTLDGQLKSIEVSHERYKDALELGKVVDGSSTYFAPIEKSDLLIKPAKETFSQLPWNRAVGKVFCDIYHPAERADEFGKERELESSPRYVLKKMLAEANESGYILQAGVEMEYFILDNGSPVDRYGYFSTTPLDKGAPHRRELLQTLESVGIEGEYMHHEVATGQNEICLRHNNALTMADNIMSFKFIAKNLLALKGLGITFMPKPFAGINGSGMHIHMSLRDTQSGINLFHGEERVSQIAKYFIGGVLKHAKALAAIAAPTVNSYKRLVAGYEAPVYVTWGHMNRSALVRIPSFNSAKAARIELRMPDPSSNPYLVYACTLAAGLEGVEARIDPGEPCSENTYHTEGKYPILPANPVQALEELRKDRLFEDVLGSDALQRYISIKSDEWNQYTKLNPDWNPLEITKWEIERYLEAA